MNVVVNIIYGILYGIAVILPGFGGATVAVICGFYEKLINCISSFIKNFRKNVVFIISFVIGVALGAFFFAKAITFFIDLSELAVNFGIIGLVIGSIPSVYKKSGIRLASLEARQVLCFSLAGMVMVVLSVAGLSGSVEVNTTSVMGVINMVFVGFVSAVGPVLPGISGGTLVVLLCGISGYDYVVGAVGAFEFARIIPFIIGAATGIVVLSKVIKYLLANYRKGTYAAIMGLLVFSVVPLYKPLPLSWEGVISVLAGLFCACLVYFSLALAQKKGLGGNIQDHFGAIAKKETLEQQVESAFDKVDTDSQHNEK